MLIKPLLKLITLLFISNFANSSELALDSLINTPKNSLLKLNHSITQIDTNNLETFDFIFLSSSTKIAFNENDLPIYKEKVVRDQGCIFQYIKSINKNEIEGFSAKITGTYAGIERMSLLLSVINYKNLISSITCPLTFTYQQIIDLFDSITSQKNSIEILSSEKAQILGGIVINKKTGEALASRKRNNSEFELLYFKNSDTMSETQAEVIGTTIALSNMPKSFVKIMKNQRYTDPVPYGLADTIIGGGGDGPYSLTTGLAFVSAYIFWPIVFVPVSLVVETALLPVSLAAHGIDSILLGLQSSKIKKAIKIILSESDHSKIYKIKDARFNFLKNAIIQK